MSKESPISEEPTPIASGGRSSSSSSSAPSGWIGDNPRARIVGYDTDGNPNCACDDGNIYINCGQNCECCDHVHTSRSLSEMPLKKYETTSCPCGFYALENNFGKIECETDGFEGKSRVAAIKVDNHYIDETAPVVGDSWDCIGGSTCSQGIVEWSTLHVVSVEESISDKFIKATNTNSSRSNCFIPKTLLSDYSEVDIIDDLKNIDGTDISNVERFIDGLPVYKNKQDAVVWNNVKGSKNNEVSEYLDVDGTTKYVPGHYYPNKKLVTACYINNRNVLDENINLNWKYASYASHKTKLVMPASGGILKLKIIGENNPVVDICIRNSSDTIILKRKLKGIVVNGEYILNQEIPALMSNKDSGKESEYYNIKITPSADTSYYHEGFIPTGILKYTVWQFKDVALTFANSLASDLSFSNATISTGTSTLRGPANSFSSEKLTITTTLTRSSGNDLYYVKPGALSVKDYITRSNTANRNKSIINKVITNQQDKQDLEYRSEITVAESDTNSGDLEPGMKFTGKIQKTKTVFKSVDLDENLTEPCDDGEMLVVLTNKFELENTSDLFSGMSVTGVDIDRKEFTSILQSVDCGKSITLESHHAIEKDTQLTFTHSDSGVVLEVNNNQVKFINPIRLPKNTELTFIKSEIPKINGTISVDKSCASPITITTVIEDVYFGQDDATYTLDVDSIITNKPPLLDKHVVVEKNSKLNAIDVGVLDLVSSGLSTSKIPDSPFTVSSATNGTASESGNYITYVPNNGYVGKDKVTFTFSDAINSSEEKTVFITVR